MTRTTILVERAIGSKTMSPEGIKELWTNLVESNPEIQGVIMDIDSDHELPSAYNEAEVRELDDLNLD